MKSVTRKQLMNEKVSKKRNPESAGGRNPCMTGVTGPSHAPTDVHARGQLNLHTPNSIYTGSNFISAFAADNNVSSLDSCYNWIN